MRAWLVLVALTAPRLAEAKGCREPSSVVGYNQCRRFGWWSSTTAMSWEAGTSWLRFIPKPVDATPADDRPVTALGLRARALLGFPYQLYFVAQVDLAEMIGGPRLIVDTAALGGMTMAMPSPSSGSLVQDSVALGWHTPLGPLTVAGELAPTFRLPSFTVQEIHLPGAWAFALQARVKTDVWLSPSWSLGFAASSDVLHTGDYSLALTLGLHVVPYDALH